MEVRKNRDQPCPSGIIAIAINSNEKAPHCGIVFTDASGSVNLCDMQYEHTLAVGPLPPRYFWTTARLEATDVILVSELLHFVIETSKMRPPPYSFIYPAEGYDATGVLSTGAGLTCATFVLKIFERLNLEVVDVRTWKPRPIQDRAFQRRLIAYARSQGHNQLQIG
jgi:hypothetical protein